MRLIDYTIKTDNLDAAHSFLVFADIHEGAAGVDYKKLHRDIAEVRDEPNTYAFYLGDGTDAISKSDLRRFDYSAIHPYYIDPEHTERLKELAKYQAKRLCEHFAEIKDKIIFGVDGNHGEKYVKTHNYDPDRTFAEFAGLLEEDKPPRYSTGVVILRLIFTDGKKSSRPFLIAAQHHCGGGSMSVDNNLNWMEKIMGGTWTNCDVYLAGHVHKRGSRRRSKIKVVSSGSVGMESDYQYFGVTGSYLRLYVDGQSSYAEGRYKPADLGALHLEINPSEEDIKLY